MRGIVGLISAPYSVVARACNQSGCLGNVAIVVLSILATPFLAIILLIRGLFGAIFHPGIMFTVPDAP